MTADADREAGLENREGSGFSAELPPRPAPSVRLGPTTVGRHNTLRAGIIPIACWRLEDVHFEFDSSFLRPEVGPGMAKLARLVADHPGAPLSVFGHADPVGRDDYNKKLSGRRAASVYALLTRKADIWEDIYRNTGRFASALTSDEWGVRAVQVMLQALGYDPGGIDGRMGDGARSAVRRLQEQAGLSVDGDPGPATREKLFLAYMDRICTDGDGQPFRLDAAAFFAGGADPGGRGDYQGCGEFNPLLLFSRSESERLANARDERDRENAPNRRVMILLFRPGSRIRPDRWPCPQAAEGAERCRRRLFSDADTRRSFREERRLFEETRDTFACRFYHHLTSDSPCERVTPFVTSTFIEFLFRDEANHPGEVLCDFVDAEDNVERALRAEDGRLFRDRIRDGVCRVVLLDIQAVSWEPERVRTGEPVEVVVRIEPLLAGIPVSLEIYREGRERSDEVVARFTAVATDDRGEARFAWEHQRSRAENGPQRFIAKARSDRLWMKSAPLSVLLPMLSNAHWEGSAASGPSVLRLTVSAQGIKPGTEFTFSIHRMHFLGKDEDVVTLGPVAGQDGSIQATWLSELARTDRDIGQTHAFVYFTVEADGEELRSNHILVALPPEQASVPSQLRADEIAESEPESSFDWHDPSEFL